MTPKKTQISLVLSQDDLDQIDREWRANLECKSRSEYLRQKIGISAKLSEEC